jgi:GNAT superfamily N-acetyltransferase
VKLEVRPLADDDVEAAEDLFAVAFTAMRTEYGLPTVPRTPASRASGHRRMRHLLATDPDGGWVGVDSDGRVVGLAQAFVRDRLWVLSLFGVHPDAQGQGLATRLLDASLTCAPADGPGLIVSSRDPRAMRRYTLAGFTLHPAVTGWGTVHRSGLGIAPDVVARADLDLAEHVDRGVRGAVRPTDLEHFLADGRRMLVVPGRGYAIVRDAGQPEIVAALDAEAAVQLLTSALVDAPPDATVEVKWMTAAQQWAVRVSLAAGLELHPVGPVMVRAMPGPFSPYLPSGAFA